MRPTFARFTFVSHSPLSTITPGYIPKSRGEGAPAGSFILPNQLSEDEGLSSAEYVS